MTTEASTYLDVDWNAFDPWRIQPVRHHLADHALLQMPALCELGKRLESKGRVRTHSSEATAATAFNHAPSLHPNLRGAAKTLADVENAAAWLSLLNVQADAEYRPLVDSVLNPVRRNIELLDPGMCYRAGWIFVSSPAAVTPFHMDKEHNFILQIRGSKRIYVWDHDDTEVVSELARDQFHRSHSRDLILWRDEFRERAQIFDLTAGTGAYMPSTSPHMVENGDEVSITMSFTYYTRATRRNSLLHRVHDHMRALGLAPPAVGRYPVLDSMTCAAATSLSNSRRMARRLSGRPSQKVFPDSVPYAIPRRP